MSSVARKSSRERSGRPATFAELRRPTALLQTDVTVSTKHLEALLASHDELAAVARVAAVALVATGDLSKPEDEDHARLVAPIRELAIRCGIPADGVNVRELAIFSIGAALGRLESQRLPAVATTHAHDTAADGEAGARSGGGGPQPNGVVGTEGGPRRSL